MLLNYHICCLILSLLCVGDLVRLVLGGVRFAGFSRIASDIKLVFHSSTVTMMHGPINIRLLVWYYARYCSLSVAQILKKCVQKMKLLPASGERNVILAVDWL